MTLQQLRYIVTLGDCGNFVTAARMCHVSQSTLSAQVKKLELYLGAALFERGGRRTVRLTDFGAKVISQARIIVEASTRIRESARNLADPMAGELRLATIPGVWPYIAPGLLPAIGARYPRLRLAVEDAARGDPERAVAAGKADAALLDHEPWAEALSACALFREPYVAILSRNHPFAAGDRVVWTALREPGRQPGHAGSARALPQQEESARSAVFAGARDGDGMADVETLAASVVAGGDRCAVVPALAAASLCNAIPFPDVVIRPLAPPVPSRTVYLAWRQRSSRNGSFRQWSEFIRGHLQATIETIRAC